MLSVPIPASKVGATILSKRASRGLGSSLTSTFSSCPNDVMVLLTLMAH